MRDDDDTKRREDGEEPADANVSPALPSEEPREQCDWCGSTDLWWRNCKLLCRNCSAIVKSCADL
jgi:hypothetical protein